MYLWITQLEILKLNWKPDPLTITPPTSVVTPVASCTLVTLLGLGDNSSDLQYKSTSSLSANSGTIRDNSSNDATLTLPDNGSSDSLGGNKAIVIDTEKPIATLISCQVEQCVNVTPSTGYVTVRSTEIGTAYLVKSTVSVNNVLTNITEDLPDNEFNSGDIILADNDTRVYTTGLRTATYKVYAVDAVGNVSDAAVGPGGWERL